MPYILRAARAIMTLLSPMTGTVATGNLTVQATGADVVLPKNSYAIPIIPGAGSNAQLSPHVLLKTTAETTVTAAGVSVPVKTVLGGIGGNLATAVNARWSPGIEGVEAVSPVAAPGLTGGAAPTGYGGVKEVRLYEQLGSARSQHDIYKSKLGRFPAIVIFWSGTVADDRRGTNRRSYTESWVLSVVTSRADSDDERRAEGLHILEEASEFLTNRTEVDGEGLSSPMALAITRRDRLVAADTYYVYTISFQTQHTMCMREWRAFPYWETWVQDHDTQSGEDPEVPIVDNAIYEMPDPEA